MAARVRTAHLDPGSDYHEIVRILGQLEFPFDIVQATSFALFRTYAVPSIGALLDRTGEFAERPQKRYDDTVLLLDGPLEEGFDSEVGRTSVRRINAMHRRYDISNDDLRYVLSTFVVVPKRWIDDYGWRRLTEDEVAASVRYYRELGRRMGIRDIPETYEAFARLMDDYEAEHFGYDAGGRRVADATLELFGTFQPWPLRRLAVTASRALMDPPLREAFRYGDPGPLVRRLVTGSLRLRGRVVALLPPRRRPVRARNLRRITSYPHGYDVAALGTFAPGCPFPHADLSPGNRPGRATAP